MYIMWNLVIFLFSCLFETTLAFPSGAPARACKDGLPHHGSSKPQVGPSPFSVTAEYSGAFISVTIEDTKDHTMFKGFLIQAFSNDHGGMIDDGMFQSSDIAKALECTPGLKNSLTHNSREEKSVLKAIWIPPNGMQENIFFRVTIVEKKDTFWIGIRSNVISVTTTGERPKSTNPVTDFQSSTPAINVSSDIYSGCGSWKGCFGYPSNCIQKRSCEMVLSYRSFNNESSVDFELVGSLGAKTEGWFATGLSRDDKMGDDSVTECVFYKGKVETYESWNYVTERSKGNVRLDGHSNITTLSLDYADGIVSCRWLRPARTVANWITFDVKEQNFYLLLAKGELNGNGEKEYHHGNTAVSSSKVDLFVANLIKSKPTTLVKLHGSLMTIAWIFFVSLAILLARHYKEVWPKWDFLGTKIWFTIHRSFMILAIGCACAGFTIIFVDVRGWSLVGANPHPILGIIATVLMFLQPFIAILRPPPHSPKRPIFRWIHGLIGNGAQLLACVNMFFAVSLSRSNLPSAFYWVLATFIVFHCLTHLLIHVHTYLMEREREKEGRKLEKPGQFQPGDGYSKVEEGPGSAFKKFVLGLYSLVVTGLTVALVIMICLN